MLYARKDCLSLLVLVSLFLFTGCATTPSPDKKTENIFFPPPPAPPRFQYLASFTGAADIESDKSAFDVFVTGEGKNADRLSKPYGVAMHDGNIYVCDTNRTVMKFDLKTGKFHPLEGAHGPGKLIQPLNISITPDGIKYVADPVRKQVVAFDKNDFYINSFGVPKDWRPVDAEPFGGRLYVADAENGEIKVFDLESGRIVKRFSKLDEEKGKLGIPTNLVIDKGGTIYVSDAGRFQILKFDVDGHFLGEIGAAGQSPGHFARPRGVATDQEKRLFVADAAFDNIQMFDNDGQLLTYFAGPGKFPGFLNLAAGIAIDYENIDYFRKYAAEDFNIEYLVVAVSQFGERMVNVYGFGTEQGREYPSKEELLKEMQTKIEEWKEAAIDPEEKN